MFDIAWSELLLIAVVALIFIGPKELPQVMYKLAQGISKLRNQADEFRRQFEESAREAGFQDLQKNLQDFKQLNPANQLKDSIDKALSHDSLNTISSPQSTQTVAETSAGLAQPVGADEDPAVGAKTPSSGPAANVVIDPHNTASGESVERQPQQLEPHRVADALSGDYQQAANPAPVKTGVEHDEKPKPNSTANGSGFDRPWPMA